MEGRHEPVPVQWVRVGYSILIPLVIGLMILNVSGDWIRKMIVLRFRLGHTPVVRPAPPRFRMPGTERLQHALLTITFGVLAWSGFSLVYPDQWWARPLSYWETTWPVRGTVHRIAAGAFVALCLVHVFEIAISREARRRWKTVLPRHRDIPEAAGTFAYNVGLRSARHPPSGRIRGLRRPRYWALVWGALDHVHDRRAALGQHVLPGAGSTKQWFDVADRHSLLRGSAGHHGHRGAGTSTT